MWGKSRYSLRPSSLSNEVQVAWNGPSEFSHATEDIIKEATEKYFATTQTGVHFYVQTPLKVMSGTIKSYFIRPSRIEM